MTMRIEEHQHGRILVLTPVGDLTLETYPAFLARLDALHPLGAPGVLVDLSEVDMLGSCAIGCLMHAALRLHNGGGHVALCCLREHTRESMAAVGLLELEVFGIYGSKETALAVLEAKLKGRSQTA